MVMFIFDYFSIINKLMIIVEYLQNQVLHLHHIYKKWNPNIIKTKYKQELRFEWSETIDLTMFFSYCNFRPLKKRFA